MVQDVLHFTKLRHLLSYRNNFQLMGNLYFEHSVKSENWREQSASFFKWNSHQNFMFKCKSWLENSAEPLKMFYTNIFLKLYRVITRVLKEGLVDLETHKILHYSKRLVISLNTVNLFHCYVIGISSALKQQIDKVKSILYLFCSYIHKFIFLYFMPQFLKYWILSYCI